MRRAAPRRARARPAAALTRALPLARAAGIAAYTKEFETTPAPARPLAQPLETKASRKQKQRDVKALAHAAELKELSKAWDPTNDPKLEGDPFKTLLVARLAYTVTESKLRREFEAFGPVRRVRIVVDPKTEQPRGYAFVEFFHSGDMKAAYKEADGMKMEGRRILVDVERARTVEGFKPRRLGGGLGDTRRDRAPGTKPVGPTIYKDTSSMADRGRQAASGGYGGGGYGSRGGGGVGYGDRDRYGGYSRSHSGYGGNDRYDHRHDSRSYDRRDDRYDDRYGGRGGDRDRGYREDRYDGGRSDPRGGHDRGGGYGRERERDSRYGSGGGYGRENPPPGPPRRDSPEEGEAR